MRPDTFAGPMERNESPENVSLSGFTLGLASAFPAGFAVAFAGDLSAGFSADFAAGLELEPEDCAAAMGASETSKETSNRACVGRRRIMFAVLVEVGWRSPVQRDVWVSDPSVERSVPGVSTPPRG